MWLVRLKNKFKVLFHVNDLHLSSHMCLVAPMVESSGPEQDLSTLAVFATSLKSQSGGSQKRVKGGWQCLLPSLGLGKLGTWGGQGKITRNPGTSSSFS